MSKSPHQRTYVALPTTVDDGTGAKVVSYDQRKIKSVVRKTKPLPRAVLTIIDEGMKSDRVMPRAFEFGFKITIPAKRDNPTGGRLGLRYPGGVLCLRKRHRGRQHEDREDRDEPEHPSATTVTAANSTKVHLHRLICCKHHLPDWAKRQRTAPEPGAAKPRPLPSFDTFSSGSQRKSVGLSVCQQHAPRVPSASAAPVNAGYHGFRASALRAPNASTPACPVLHWL